MRCGIWMSAACSKIVFLLYFVIISVNVRGRTRADFTPKSSAIESSSVSAWAAIMLVDAMMHKGVLLSSVTINGCSGSMEIAGFGIVLPLNVEASLYQIAPTTSNLFHLFNSEPSSNVSMSTMALSELNPLLMLS